MGILKRKGRGLFCLGKGIRYQPEVSIKLKSIYKKIQKEFPFLKVCIWNTSVLNEFMIHQPGRFYIIIEVEKDAAQSVFFFLKESKYPVFIEPTIEIIEKYMPDEKEVLIVKSLVSEAPLLRLNGINTVSIEKILVDIFCDDIIFSAQQGSEMRTIFNEAFGKYSVNETRMLRYADRRRKKESFNNYLKTKIRQQN